MAIKRPAIAAPNRPLPNSYWVIPGRFLAGEHPLGAHQAETLERLKRLREAGINSFVDLTETHELLEYRHLLPRQIDYLRCAIVDTQVPDTVAQAQAALASIRAGLERGRSIYLHCRAGIGRTGLVVGCYLADEERDGEAALLRLNHLWQQSARSASWPTIPQTPEQADYIRQWPALSKTAGRTRE